MVWPRRNHRAFVGSNPTLYDFEGASQFNLLTLLGLREDQYVLDIGCGSLRAGRLLIPYLQRGHYHGLDPDRSLVLQGVKNEVGDDLLKLRGPVFVHNADFKLDQIQQPFDFILANSIFSHASREQILLCLRLVAETLDGNGVFLASYYPGKESYAGKAWVYPENVCYRSTDLVEMAALNGLHLVEIAWPHVNDQRWVMIARHEESLARFRLDDQDLLLAEQAARQAASKLYREITRDPLYGWLVRIRALLTELGFKKPRA